MNIKNILKNIMYKLGLIADYVTERGSSGIWTYEKWRSGKAVCWGRATTTLANSGEVWSNPLYAYLNTARPNYPFTFLEPPSEVAQIVGSVNAMWLYKQSSENNTATQTAHYALIKISSFTANTTAEIAYQVIGKIGGGN